MPEKNAHKQQKKEARKSLLKMGFKNSDIFEEYRISIPEINSYLEFMVSYIQRRYYGVQSIRRRASI